MSPRRKSPVDLAASIRQRLRNLASTQGADFRLTLERYGAERFLYRLGESSEKNHFVLKGAMPSNCGPSRSFGPLVMWTCWLTARWTT